LDQRQLAELRQENARLAGLSLTDPLTGVPNRAAFNAELRSCTARLARGRTSWLAITMFDLDGFKKINDEHGHQVGDEVLHKMAQAGAHAVRTDELFARLGGDEFVLVLEPETIEEIRAAVEQLRHEMTAAAAQLDSGLDVGVSAGGVFVAGTCHESVWADERALVKKTDDALYEAKHAGRNTSVITSNDQVAS